MSVKFCAASETGFHLYERKPGSKVPVCRHCHMTRQQLQEQAAQIAQGHLQKARELTPERIAELDAMKPYKDRRQRYSQRLDALQNLAAFQLDKLPAPVPADVRPQVSAAVEALRAAVAGVRDEELRESLWLALCIAEAAGATMEARVIARQKMQRAAA